GARCFLGVKYADVPVRWGPPTLRHDKPTMDNHTFGPAAIQSLPMTHLNVPESEDCLNLNIWTPASLSALANRPVLVWFHGGGFVTWTASMAEWNGTQLAKNNNVVVVSLNYRMGPLGFAYHPDVGCNLAVLDWVCALAWVNAHIRHVGGNPDNVTIFGHSAGGMAVHALLRTPSARGLFHKAVLMSPVASDYAHLPPVDLDRLKANSLRFFDRLGTHDLSTLRQLPLDTIKRQLGECLAVSLPDGQLQVPADLIWAPVQDDKIVFSMDACAKDVPLLFGYTNHEARFFLRPWGRYGLPRLQDPETLYNTTTLHQLCHRLAGPCAAQLIAYFSSSTLTAYEAIDALVTTALWKAPARQAFDYYATHGMQAYMYCFARVSPGSQASGEMAYHCSEIPYFFAHVTEGDVYDRKDVALSNEIQHGLCTFAATGEPRFLNHKPWPKATVSEPRLTLLDDQ
ncbi:alpha/beta-hydrolase, partial [Hesseltinella vesiculosa]